MLRRWGVIFWGILFSFSLHAQMGIGTDMPDPAGELEIKFANRGLLIPRIGLTSSTDQSTISAGNIESLLVYNTTSNDNLNLGFNYWYNAKWRRLSDDNNLPDNLVIWEEVNNQFTYIDQNGDAHIIEMDFQETLTQNHQNSFTLIDGENTLIESTKTGNNTQYQINAPIAKGAQENTTSIYGVVKASPENPSVANSQQGELSLNLENLNNIKIVNQDYTAESKDPLILGSANIGTLTITLHDLTAHKRKIYIIEKEDNYVQVVGFILGLHAGEQLYTARSLTGWDNISDGTTWRIVNKF